MALTINQSIADQVYLAFFSRPTDTGTLQSFGANLVNGSPTLAQMQSLFNTTEGKSIYGSAPTVSAVVAKAFEIVGRSATSSDLQKWSDWINATKMDIAQIPWEVMKVALATEKDLPQASQVAWARLAVSYQLAEDLSANPTTVINLSSNATTQNDARAVITGVTSFATISTAYPASGAGTAANFVTGSSAAAGSTFTLTKGIDEITGGTSNDTFNGTEDNTAAATFSNLDKLDGGAGTDTLKIVQAAAIDTTTVTGATVSNIENINITSGAAVTTNTSTWTGASALTIAAGTNVTATAAATTDITAGASALAAGAGDEISINGGKAVTVTAADTSTTGAASGNTIVVGGTTAAAGAVKVTYTETISDAANAGVAGSTITVTGGTTVEVNSLAVAGAGSNVADVLTLGQVDVNGNASTTSVTVKQSAATATYDGTTQKNISIVNGAVNVVDTNAATASDTITTVTLENFGASEIKSTVLGTLNLTAGATIAGGAVTLTQTAADKSTAATTLALNTSGSFGKISGTQADVYKTVNVTAAAATTIADIEMDALTTLNVAGTGVTTFTALTAAQNAKLATIASTGGGLTIGTELATGVAVTGGTGVESILIGATTKTIDLGAGNDVVTVSTTTMGAGGAVKGGDGTDTLVANTNGSAFAGLPAFTGFETLRVAGAAAEGAHNAVGFTALELGATKAAVSSFTNVAAGVGLTVLAAPGGAHTVTLGDATGKADSFDLTFKSAGALDLSTNSITLAGVETIKITNTDTNTTAHTNKLKLVADTVTTLSVTGNAGLDLTGSVYAKVTKFDASAITGAEADAAALAVTYVSGNTTIAESVTITGGSGNDSLTGNAANNDTIIGGAGVDTLTYTGGTDSFTGGAGKDAFVTKALGTSTSYLTIADAVAGDTIDTSAITTVTIGAMTAAQSAAAKVVLGSGATFTQYLNDAAKNTGGVGFGAGNTKFAWFQFESNTYIVIDDTVGTDTFTAADSVIKLTGIVDLATATNSAGDVLTLA